MPRLGDLDLNRRDLLVGASAAATLAGVPSGAGAKPAGTDEAVMAKVAFSVELVGSVAGSGRPCIPPRAKPKT